MIGIGLKQILRRVFILFCTIGFLTACISTKSPTIDTNCGPWNFGIAQASSFDHQFLSESWMQDLKTTCLKTTYAKGFDEFDPPIDAKFKYRTEESVVKRRAVSSVDSKGKSKSSSSLPRSVFQMTFQNGHYNFELDANSRWEADTSPSPLYQVFAKNSETKAALFISVFDANPFLIWSDSRDSMYLRMRDQLAYSDITRIKETKFQNLDGFQVEYRGRDKNSVPLHFLSTQIRVGKKILYLTTWSFEEDYAKNEDEFHLIANSIRMKPRFLTWLNND